VRIPRVLQRSVSAMSRGWLAVGRGYRIGVTAGRWVIVAFWVAAATLITVLIPSTSGGSGFGNLLPPDSPVLKVEERVLQEFRVPVLAGTTVVVHQPGGLSLLTRADSILWALATTQEVVQAPTDPPPGSLLAAIPVPTGRADTTVTYLYVTEGTGLRNTVLLASTYAAHFKNQSAVDAYVTGFVPAQVAQGDYLRSRLRLFEIASVLLILVVVALAFRSLLAPLVVLGIAAIGYLIYFPLLDQLAHALNFEVPRQLEPVLLALLLGVVTDYCVLFFAAFRDELDTGTDAVTSTRNALRLNGSVVAVAGLTVAGGTIALLAAPFEIFRALGPALSLTVLVGLALCLTLTPAIMTILS
jgi:RND superfamily putative drug exporter